MIDLLESLQGFLAAASTLVVWLANISRTVKRRSAVLAQSPLYFITKSLRETMRKHLWVAPFPEEDPTEIIDLLGADHVLFGSDYPHPEGIAEPAAYLRMLKGQPESEVRKIMHDNAAELLGLM